MLSRFKFLVIFTCAMCMSCPAFGKEYAYVDVQKALNMSKAGKAAKELLSEWVGKYQKEINSQQDELKRLKNDDNMIQEYSNKLKEFKKFTNDAQNDLQKKDEDLTKMILSGFEAIVRDFYKESQYRAICPLLDRPNVCETVITGSAIRTVTKKEADDVTERLTCLVWRCVSTALNSSR